MIFGERYSQEKKENLVAFRLQLSFSASAATFVYPNPASDEVGSSVVQSPMLL
jgi:hypothetical protein